MMTLPLVPTRSNVAVITTTIHTDEEGDKPVNRSTTVLYDSITVLCFLILLFLAFLFKYKKEKRVGGYYWRKVLHIGTGEKENPVLPMGRRKKSLVDHRNLIIKRKEASMVGLPSSCSGLLTKNLIVTC